MLYIGVAHNTRSKMKPLTRIEARKLRIQGLPIKKIARELDVSASSVSVWVRDIALTEEQTKILEQQNPLFNKQISGGKVRADRARAQRLQYQQEGKDSARHGNLLHQAGCLLYWAEGKKSKNICCLTNSDSHLLKLFIKFLRECFSLDNSQFTIACNYYTNNGLTREDIENYWLQELGLDHTALRKGQENNRPRSATNATRHNKLPYGMCSLTVKSSTKIVQHIYGAIQEYANFSNNYMLM